MTSPHEGAVPAGPGPDRRIRGRRVAGGIAVAILGHLVTVAIALPTLTASEQTLDNMTWFIGALFGQVVLFLGCLCVGIVLIVRRERGFGLGLLIGWAVGLLVISGVCVPALRSG
jgi:hypothetical protein